VRRHEDVHHRERGGGTDAVQEHVLAADAPSDGEDHREHHDQTGVEEHREAHDERRNAEREGCPLLTEDGHHLLGQHTSAARGFHQRPSIAPYSAKSKYSRALPMLEASVARRRFAAYPGSSEVVSTGVRRSVTAISFDRHGTAACAIRPSTQ
jgi:hypothetical protein